MPERTQCERFRAAASPSGPRAVWELAALLAVSLVLPFILLAVFAPLPKAGRAVTWVLGPASTLLSLVLVVASARAVNRIDYVLTEKALEIWIGPWRGPVLKYGSIVGAWIPEEIPTYGWYSWTGVRHSGLWITTVRPKGIGPVALYATRIDRHLVLVKTSARTYGLSPEEPEAFLTSLRARMARA
ncbi:MAG: PH domain-containing protein [Chloroflexi bacterium]|nr:PH domain-containing protein [Chloroflexota bacterium]